MTSDEEFIARLREWAQAPQLSDAELIEAFGSSVAAARIRLGISGRRRLEQIEAPPKRAMH